MMDGVFEYPPSRVMRVDELARRRAPKREAQSVKIEQEDDVLMEGRGEVWSHADAEGGADSDTIAFSDREEKEDEQRSTDSSL